MRVGVQQEESKRCQHSCARKKGGGGVSESACVREKCNEEAYWTRQHTMVEAYKLWVGRWNAGQWEPSENHVHRRRVLITSSLCVALPTPLEDTAGAMIAARMSETETTCVVCAKYTRQCKLCGGHDVMWRGEGGATHGQQRGCECNETIHNRH